VTSQPPNQAAEIPPELDRWNWGAFLLNWIWGIGNSTFIALLALIPGVNIVMMFVLGARGSRWAWRNRHWRDAEQFRRTQRNWATAGLIIWIVVIGGCTSLVGGFPLMLKSSDAYKLTMESVRGNDRVKAAMGESLGESYWIGGNVNVAAGGGGFAQFVVPVQGSTGSGTVTSQAVRKNGIWSIQLLVVRVDGSEMPIVIINKGRKADPNAEIGV
jgi:hypothetical protein